MQTDTNLIDQDILEEVIRNLLERLNAHYIFPDVATEICIRLQRYFEEGAYNDISDGEFLALTLTKHIQEVNQDKHLWVRWHPDPLPDHEGSLLNNREKIEDWKRKARLENYGIYKVERLPGNVGCIDVRYFYRTSWGSGETLVAAMNLLANTGAIIFDLRKCKGGNPATVAMICSYFFDEQPVHLNDLYWRENDLTEQYWTLPHVPGLRMIEQPVYILTSKDTFSAGEEFSYNLQSLERATIIGEATAGGAHPGSSYRLHPHFEVFIPNGRAINPITKQNWEGVGVRPDIAVDKEQAMNTAYRLVLNAIIEDMPQLVSKSMAILLEEAKTALQNIDGV